MEIISKIVEIEVDLPPTVESIENKLAELGIKVLRWAIVKVEGNTLTISLACENL